MYSVATSHHLNLLNVVHLIMNFNHIGLISSHSPLSPKRLLHICISAVCILWSRCGELAFGPGSN